ncbi:MAG: DUF2442 domain-containing protein [Clostridia bacterium]|nr:DUF2442 domain-containing protein [Clostridia bacterium]
MIPPRIKNVKAHENYTLELEYSNGEKKLYDMNKQLDYSWFIALKNIAYFMLAKSVETTVEWPNGEDMDPNELYFNSIVMS